MFIMGGFVALFIGQAIYMEIEGVRKHGWRFLCGSHYFDCDETDDDPDATTTSDSSHAEHRPDSGNPGSAIQANLVTFLASIGMCAAFFMPWISIMGLGVSGTTIGKIGDGGQAAWLILVLAVISAALHLARPNRILHVITGISPFALLIYFVSNAPRDLGDHLFEALSVGAYLLLICGLCLIFAPVRNAK